MKFPAVVHWSVVLLTSFLSAFLFGFCYFMSWEWTLFAVQSVGARMHSSCFEKYVQAPKPSNKAGLRHQALPSTFTYFVCSSRRNRTFYCCIEYSAGHLPPVINIYCLPLEACKNLLSSFLYLGCHGNILCSLMYSSRTRSRSASFWMQHDLPHESDPERRLLTAVPTFSSYLNNI